MSPFSFCCHLATQPLTALQAPGRCPVHPSIRLEFCRPARLSANTLGNLEGVGGNKSGLFSTSALTWSRQRTRLIASTQGHRKGKPSIALPHPQGQSSQPNKRENHHRQQKTLQSSWLLYEQNSSCRVLSWLPRGKAMLAQFTHFPPEQDYLQRAGGLSPCENSGTGRPRSFLPSSASRLVVHGFFLPQLHMGWKQHWI